MGLIFFLILSQPPLETNPVKIVFKTAIRLYQKVIAPVQGDVCNFSPSCSKFGTEAIDKYGLFLGTLMSADRLMRCNPSALNHYDSFYSGIKDDKIYDPVENNHIFKPIKKPFAIDIEPIK